MAASIPWAPGALIAAGATGLRINVRDDAVKPGDGLVQRWQDPQPAAIAQFWLPSANARFRGPIDAALAAHSARFALWLVAESTIRARKLAISLPSLCISFAMFPCLSRKWVRLDMYISCWFSYGCKCSEIS